MVTDDPIYLIHCIALLLYVLQNIINGTVQSWWLDEQVNGDIYIFS